MSRFGKALRQQAGFPSLIAVSRFLRSIRLVLVPYIFYTPHSLCNRHIPYVGRFSRGFPTTFSRQNL
jgi:hypothetical protein